MIEFTLSPVSADTASNSDIRPGEVLQRKDLLESFALSPVAAEMARLEIPEGVPPFEPERPDDPPRDDVVNGVAPGVWMRNGQIYELTTDPTKTFGTLVDQPPC